VIMMDEYVPKDKTAEARRVAENFSTRRSFEGGEHFGTVRARWPRPESIDPRRGPKKKVKIAAKSLKLIGFGEEWIDLSAVEQLVDISQTRAVGDTLHYALGNYIDGERTLGEILDLIEADLDREGLDAVSGYMKGNLARPRRFEVAAALNRLRTLRCG